MAGETNLTILLQSMQPELQEGEYVFCAVLPERLAALDIVPIGQFRETEGITLILRREQAERAGLEYAFVARMITLSVHSGLEAVGFLAAISNLLAVHGISVNVVSAYYHDHLFVPSDKAEQTMRLLREMG